MTELNEKDLKKYEAPQMNVVEVELQQTLCQSGSGETIIEDDHPSTP